MNRICRRVFIPLSKYPLSGIDASERHCSILCLNNFIFPNASQVKPFKSYQDNAISTQCRYKSKKAKSKADSDDEEDFEDGDASLSRDSKVVKFNTTSLRADGILKLGLGVARNKIEQKFYESKLRVNGKKILKKSVSVRIGDELDVIKSVSPRNPDHLNITRLEILDIVANEDSIDVKARRFKSLLIENYKEDPFKGVSSEGNS